MRVFLLRLPSVSGLTLKSLMLIALTTLTPSISFAPSVAYASTDRPYWTEQASFSFSDSLYVIGVATNAPTVEAGRQAAFEHGLREIMNYAQVSNLNNLQVHTERNFEEPQRDGRVSVWRLLRVSMDDLRVLKATKTLPTPTQIHATMPQDAPPISTEQPRTPAATPTAPVRANKPKAPEVAAVITVTTQRLREPQEANLPIIPLRYPKVMTGWQRDAAHGLTPKWEERPDWAMAHKIVLPSYSIY